MTHGSLFSGVGGFDLAAEWMGWENVFHCEKAPYQRGVLARRFSEAKGFDDVRAICSVVDAGKVDVLTGGFPCVDITNAKNAIEKPQGLDGEESGLWSEFRRIIGLLRPGWAVVENSANLNIRGLSRVVGDFTSLRYDCIWFNVSASRVGAPHRRRRTFIVAHSNEQGLEGDVCKKLAGEIKRRFDPDVARSAWWDTEPGLDRLANGVPGGVDFKKQRLEAGGNAVVPQVAYQIFRAIELASCEKSELL